MRIPTLLFVLLAIQACASGTRPVLPADAVVVAGANAAGLLHPCSRDAPLAVEGTWQPRVEDILAIERVLRQTLVSRPPYGDADWSKAPSGWRRQYVGIVRNGHRYIYGSFFPKHAMDDRSWRAEPVVYCDGGPRYFSIEYDPASRRMTLAFNGEA